MPGVLCASGLVGLKQDEQLVSNARSSEFILKAMQKLYRVLSRGGCDRIYHLNRSLRLSGERIRRQDWTGRQTG
jgi:hypothetical protein